VSALLNPLDSVLIYTKKCNQKGTTMATGRVKWFNNAKGYGFILSDDIEGDLFAHYSSIQMDGYRTLKAGQTVNFDIIDGDKGSHAINIIPELEHALENVKAPRKSSAETDAKLDEHIEAL
jgi:CspA family cold shock protein